MAQAIKAVIGGKTVMFDLPQSKIGYTYPRLFIDIGDGTYINYDFVVDAAFKMPAKNWDDWMSDAINVSEKGGAEKFCAEINLNYSALCDALAQMKSA